MKKGQFRGVNSSLVVIYWSGVVAQCYTFTGVEDDYGIRLNYEQQRLKNEKENLVPERALFDLHTLLPGGE